MTRHKMATLIRQRMKREKDVDVSLETIKQILEIEEDEIYSIIALNDSFQYKWGTISGIEKAPRKLSGTFTQRRTVRENYGYSRWKMGYPNIKWSKECLECDTKSPADYFELDEHRYTTVARQFRRDAGFEEIPEYQVLSEEKILEMCKKADDIEFSKLSKKQQTRKLIDKRVNRQKIIGAQKVWAEENYIPMGAWAYDYNGPQRDAVDCILNQYIYSDDEGCNSARKLRILMYTKDFAIFKHLDSDHPELDGLIDKYKKMVEEEGLEEIPYKNPFKSDYFLKKDKLKLENLMAKDDDTEINLFKKNKPRKFVDLNKEEREVLAEENLRKMQSELGVEIIEEEIDKDISLEEKLKYIDINKILSGK